MIIVDQRFTIA
ncbi:hypothetical protein D049_3207, partial [Vibrio parahaemolyticus VPTS-2010]